MNKKHSYDFSSFSHIDFYNQLVTNFNNFSNNLHTPNIINELYELLKPHVTKDNFKLNNLSTVSIIACNDNNYQFIKFLKGYKLIECNIKSYNKDNKTITLIYKIYDQKINLEISFINEQLFKHIRSYFFRRNKIFIRNILIYSNWTKYNIRTLRTCIKSPQQIRII